MKDHSRAIIGAAFRVANALGSGLLEKVYENALCIELRELGIDFIQQDPIKVIYKNKEVGNYIADIVVEDCIIELKSVSNLTELHMAQLLHYLRATKRELGLLINFGNPKVEIRRVINSRKCHKLL